ncbi:MAG TPA: cation:proton antiporter [Streptosporangiaceae bacterium]|jgi:Kef-type K+ transport system membrane component KefB
MDSLIADVIGDIALVLAVSALFSVAARRCGQPAVIGQIIAGIALGPSLLGRLPGHLSSRLFPAAALPYLNVIAQVAVAIFMFSVGYEFSWGHFRRGYRASLLVAAGALVIPMTLGSGSAVLFRSGFAGLGQRATGHSFILYMGVATSITALPVLAAIMRERGLPGTVAGVTATTAAGIMDVAAWLTLAAALVGTTAKAGRPWPATLALITGFAAVMLLAVRPALRWAIRRPRALLASHLPLALALTMGCAWVTASLGLHPVFGGLLAGFTMPGREDSPDPDVLAPMANVSGLLLPLFFIVTGLSVNIGALTGGAFALIALLTAIACAGKVIPGYLGSRIGGLDHKDAATVAALVNTRGLTELIVLNLGLSAGLISERLFSVLVVMAVLTTVMTAPLLSWIRPRTMPASAGGLPATLRAAGHEGR